MAQTPVRKNKRRSTQLIAQQLQESEERFRNLADTAPMFIAMADASGKAVYFNKPWLEYTGKKLDDMLGLGWLSTLHPEDAPKFEKDFKEAFKNQVPINKEYRFIRADGQFRWMLAVGSPRFTPDGHFIGYYGTYTDIHDLKEAQLKVAVSEERFRTLIEKSADAIQLVSPVGEIIFSSDSVKNVLGYTPEEIAHEGVTPYIHPDDREYFFSNFNELVKRPGQQLTMQYRVKHKDGSWAWLETTIVNHVKTPYIEAFVGNFRNITQQKKSERKLLESEERFRVLANNIPNLAWMAQANGDVYWYNNRWYEYTGATKEQMKGNGWHSVHNPDYLPKILEKWNTSIKDGEAIEMVAPLKGADNTFRPFLTLIVPVYSSDGKIEQWVGTHTDLTEQLRIKEAEARADELEKLNNTKDEFISLASHQLRTPATGVKQYIGMMLEGYAGELTPKQSEFARKAYESNEREISIINDLLDVAKVDSGRIQLRKKKVDFVSVINEILDEQASNFVDRGQKVKFEYADSNLTATADESRMRMVLENLVDNASKYTPESKEIVIELKRDPQDKLIVVIKDEGVGISVDDSAKIFDKFVRIDNPLSDTMGGSGLGLYLAKRIVDLHEGTIAVNSKPGKGSAFKITLPR